ncbi:sensor histidine kinase [Tissierella sp.]|uniref:sensor histidine kinase n=1 Tax=Tissierella sp. TaxID=41274 RepID=UPI002854308F|nr:sensor histidine kinase [Tissierella sp.]MDR7856813.1 sensor histidine kinase [Tissierella sp.]
MKDIMFVLLNYLKLKIKTLGVFIISICILLVVFFLYSLPLEAVLYALVLVSAFLLLIALYDFRKFYKKYIKLEEIKNSFKVNNFLFPKSKNLIDREYEELIQAIAEDRLRNINEKDIAINEMVDYYTIWAHQIKTPIAAMRLLLQSNKSNLSIDLLEELFKIEQYVEMVLQYLRMEHMSSDLQIMKYSLDGIVKQAVRKYSKIFIRKKIRLNYDDLNRFVLTDEKWLVFVIEQILSNALKYTNSGEISIYMDEALSNTLVIEDAGIGIKEEDIPLIFERGFTGFNGRSHKKSTGIGLFLCKGILDKLSHTIKIESKIDKGTKVMIGLDTAKLDVSD